MQTSDITVIFMFDPPYSILPTEPFVDLTVNIDKSGTNVPIFLQCSLSYLHKVSDIVFKLRQTIDSLSPTLPNYEIEWRVKKSFNDFIQELDYEEVSLKPIFPDEV